MRNPPGNGAERMRALMATLPRQLLEGYRAGREIPTSVSPDLRQMTVVGMGGSAIAADLAQTLTQSETELSFSVVRSPDLPRPVRVGGMVVAVSYSGNTWETLDAFAEAGRRGIRRVAITAGGALEELAFRENIPLLRVPSGSPPRSQVGFLLGGLLGLLEPVFPSTLEPRVEFAARNLEAEWGRLSSARGLPARIAARVGDRSPLVYAEDRFAGLARRWKTQVEENAKRGAGFDLLPELFHNALVGWDRSPPMDRRSKCVLLLEWSKGSEATRDRIRYLDRLLRTRQVPSVHVPLPSADLLAALLEGIAVGDLFSLALAERDHVDPYPVEAIERMKQALAKRATR